MTTITAYLRQRYPSAQHASLRRLSDACNAFVDAGLADPKFVSELTSGSNSKFWSCVSEALLAERLHNKTFPPRSVRGEGPDLLVTDGVRNVWIEVICPEPAGIPGSWLTPDQIAPVTFPHQEILLRWASAIKEKAEKLLGNSDANLAGYLQKRIVGPEDAYVIAVNGCQLRSGHFPEIFGISQFPFAAEAVFPIGPYQLQIDRDTLKVVGRGHQLRYHIKKPSGALVPASTFLDPRFNPVSAIWAVDLRSGSAQEPMAVIHNPNAINPIPLGFLPADDEYVAEETSGSEYTITRIKSSCSSDG